MTSFSLQSFLFVLLCLLAFHQCSEARFLQTSKALFRSLYTFGDSYVDPGNNDFIDTPFRSNFPPYGRDFPGKVATGRFSNGLLFPDLLAYYVGVGKYTRPYLDPLLDLKESPTAISFASATSGYDPDTANKTNAIQLIDQLENFKQYKERIAKTIGTEKAKRKIEKALFYVNAGSDDFAFTYFQDGRNQENKRTPQQYDQVLLYFIRQFLQRLLDQGARKIAVNGLPPLGCIPVGITLLPATPRNTQVVTRSQRQCLDYVNVISSDFNSMLQEELDDLQSEHPEIKITYIDFEEPLLDVIENPDDYGYTEVNKGCCGTGVSEIGTQCNGTTSLCSDADKYVFWDAAHPTQKTNEIIFKSNLAAIDDLIGS
ncbi:GDSL esterase/lipase At5g45960-like [Rhododendron vialii]|uniref:GDSL esterase/lipase At5g45960-like n=1 Tax=Rhododendron vialii TaxID=182163 RepID=UPI00265FB6F2|nr:GDSL esterase/lipase At5g45960-like [Rhododendron vialii]